MSAFNLSLRVGVGRSIALAFAALLALAIVPAREVTAQTSKCELSKSKVRVQNDRVSRTPNHQELRDVPYTEMRFTQGGDQPACVIVEFSAVVGRGKGLMSILAVLDSEATGTNTILGGVDFTPFSSDLSARTFSFAARGIAPGRYTARIQWRSRGGPVFMHERITIVEHQ